MHSGMANCYKLTAIYVLTEIITLLIFRPFCPLFHVPYFTSTVTSQNGQDKKGQKGSYQADNAHNNGCVQTVSRPTRITVHSATLIDHVYTNNIFSTLSCNKLTLYLSDNLASHTTVTLGNRTAESLRIST